MIGRILRALRPWPKHPVDRQYGIETSRRVRRFQIRTGDATADASNVGYVGSQPSIVRHALGLLPDLTGAAFFDLGCGKGRILAVATEFPFASITGVELSALVCRAAERNCERMARRHPERTRARVLHGDASQPPLPSAGAVVIYMYNPFHGDIMARLIANLTAALEARPGLKIYVVYYNPAQAALFDASPSFARVYAAQHRFSAEEQASSPFGNNEDSIAIWQSRTEPMIPALAGADRRIEITVPDLVAVVTGEPAQP